MLKEADALTDFRFFSLVGKAGGPLAKKVEAVTLSQRAVREESESSPGFDTSCS